MSDVPNIGTPRAAGIALSEAALDGLRREKAMTNAFYDFASNILNHATVTNDTRLRLLLEKAHEDWKGACK